MRREAFVKFSFRILTLLIFFLNISTTQSAPVVLFSGKPRAWQEKIVKSFLLKHKLENSSLISWVREDQKCKEDKRALIQFCFEGEKVRVIRYEKKKVKITLGRYMSYAQTTKAHHREGQR